MPESAGGITQSYRNKTRKKSDAELSNYLFGKVPPQARDLEDAVLGAMMLQKAAVGEVIDILKPDHFYHESNKRIFAAIISLFDKSEPIDILTVTQELRRAGTLDEVGGPYYVSELTNRVASAANIEYHARIVVQKYVQRELINISTKIINEAYEDTTDVFDLLQKAEQEIFTITDQNLRRGYEAADKLIMKAIDEIEQLKNRESDLTGVPSGLYDLDQQTAGWQKSDLVIIAARPGMGKTSFVLSMARNAAVQFQKKVALFSLEMSAVQLTKRLIASETEISLNKLRNGNLEEYEWVKLVEKTKELGNAELIIDDTPAINIFELRAKCRRLKQQHNIDMVIIDYLQLMSGMSEGRSFNREQEISNISRSLKTIAKELDIPVIALSQLSRAVETRGGNKRPMLSDLRECITADTLIFLPEKGVYQPVKSLLGNSGFKVLSMNEEYQLCSADCLDVWETGEKEVYELETQSGFKIKASLNHPFYTVDGWQQLVDLKAGDYVATARTLPTNNKSNLLDDEIAILAHMIGGGCYVERQPVHYTSQDEASLQFVSDAAKRLWNIQSRKVKDKNSNCYHIYLPAPYHLTHGVKHPFTLLLQKLGLEKARSYDKIIPSAIFKSNLSQIALFIKHLWSTDGGVFIRKGKGKGSSKLHYSSSSHKLVRGLKSLLLRFGIQTSIQKVDQGKHRDGFILSVTDKNSILSFANQIGIFGSKSSTLFKLAELSGQKTSNPNSDIISKTIWNEVKDIKKTKGFTERSFQAALGMQYCGSALYKSNLSRQRLEKIATVLDDDKLYQLSNSHLKWDKIKSITHLGKFMTYDIQVDRYHNFVANDFIIHNSGAIEQDADLVLFLYRPEYYGMDELDDGTPSKGLAEVIIAKHRNGPTGSVLTRFVSQYAKFADLQQSNPLHEGYVPLDQAIHESEPKTITRQSSMNNEKNTENGDGADVPF